MSKAKANLIVAVKNHCRNLYEKPLPERYTIQSPDDAAQLMMERMRFLKQEHFVCLYLNTKNQIIGEETIFIGTLNSSLVHPREVFMYAVKYSAAGIICLHNHPSGDCIPSQEDISVTKRLIDNGELMGINVLDHLIIGDKKYTSLKEKGYI